MANLLPVPDSSMSYTNRKLLGQRDYPTVAGEGPITLILLNYVHALAIVAMEFSNLAIIILSYQYIQL